VRYDDGRDAGERGRRAAERRCVRDDEARAVRLQDAGLVARARVERAIELRRGTKGLGLIQPEAVDLGDPRVDRPIVQVESGVHGPLEELPRGGRSDHDARVRQTARDSVDDFDLARRMTVAMAADVEGQQSAASECSLQSAVYRLWFTVYGSPVSA